jgi:hypothetical protein
MADEKAAQRLLVLGAHLHLGLPDGERAPLVVLRTRFMTTSPHRCQLHLA